MLNKAILVPAALAISAFAPWLVQPLLMVGGLVLCYEGFAKVWAKLVPPAPADLVVLSLLAERAMHGYELLKEYERQEVADWAPVSRPHVY